MTDTTCSTCLFHRRGACHRNPPSADRADVLGSYWPPVDPDDSCGEHQPQAYPHYLPKT